MRRGKRMIECFAASSDDALWVGVGSYQTWPKRVALDTASMYTAWCADADS